MCVSVNTIKGQALRGAKNTKNFKSSKQTKGMHLVILFSFCYWRQYVSNIFFIDFRKRFS